jgi:menaquinone-dependent protoporphyrinogen oxidase
MAARGGVGSVRAMNQNILILYASTHGHTRAIAARIAEVLEGAGAGAGVAVRDVRAQGKDIDLSAYGAVVAGGSVHGGHHQGELVAWLREHRVALGAMPSAFFSVSLTAADDSAEARGAVRAMIDDVVEATGWTPATTAAFAGALLFKEYNLTTRIMMRLTAKRFEEHTGHAVDVHADTDFTDWAAVEAFAQAFAERVAVGA